MRSSLLHECPQTPVYFLHLVFFTVDRKSSQIKTFSQNIIYLFCLYHFSVKYIIKKIIHRRTVGPLKGQFNQFKILDIIADEASWLLWKEELTGI